MQRLFELCIGTGSRGSKYRFLQGDMDVYMYIYSDGLIYIFFRYVKL